MSRFQFAVATSTDEHDLQELSRTASMQGAMRIGFDRSPNYFASLRPEGRQTEVLICRDTLSGRIVATGHRSLRQLWVNGAVMQTGYLGALRIHPDVQSGMVLARGYKFLRERHADRQTPFYLSTVLENNKPALVLLQSGRCGLPRYHDLGRFCCMAVGVRPSDFHTRSRFQVRPAAQTDGGAIVAFLSREGQKRQFFPVYRIDDFGQTNGLLPGLVWENILLAWQGSELIGVVAGWDQREFRRWYVAGYSPWLRAVRMPLNIAAKCIGFPQLPPPGTRPDYFVLSLVCIHGSDTAVFQALLDEVVARQQNRYSFFLAGLHERDPLLTALQARPHVRMSSRLFAVAWDDGAETTGILDPELVPYMEVGAL